MIQTRLARALRDAVVPLISRPAYIQVAALCLRSKNGKQQVLMIRSLGTGRWILPKGWPMDGRSLAEAALQEAWEEAGVQGSVAPEPVGHYSYSKIAEGGMALPTTVHVYAVAVDRLADSFPESARRKRKWMAPAKAAERVNEPGLRDLLAAL
ncbi:NUDIX hydrolase [Plastorhodobacter daqingensis]|uniref:NUDIX hydrolase n=1 Tax=Plastorhodobacter daqingensis TaxID=1387281 RepID=A0ABW2UR73_9RHOB